MKTLLVSLLIFLLIIGAAVGYQLYTEHIASKYIAMSRQIGLQVEQEELDRAKATFSDLKKEWEKHEPMLAIFTEHNVIDGILELFIQIETFFRHPTSSDFYQFNDRLQFQLQQLIERNQLTAEMIL